MTSLNERNRLRMEIWDLNTDLASMLGVPAQFRNSEKIEKIEAEIIQRETEIEMLLQLERQAEEAA